MWFLVAFAVWTIGFLAVVEYLLHRHIMHRPHRNPFLREAFHTHVVLHHQDARNDLNIDAEPAYNLLLGSPVIALVLGVGWLTGDPRRSWPRSLTVVRDHSEQRLPVDWLSKGLRDAKRKSLLPYPPVARHRKDGNRREPG